MNPAAVSVQSMVKPMLLPCLLGVGLAFPVAYYQMTQERGERIVTKQTEAQKEIVRQELRENAANHFSDCC